MFGKTFPDKFLEKKNRTNLLIFISLLYQNLDYFDVFLIIRSDTLVNFYHHLFPVSKI